MVGEFRNNVTRVGFETPLYPLTSLMLPYLRYGMLQFILLIGLWYSDELIHRERASGLSEIVDASPHPDWIMILSKIAAICIVVYALMLTAASTLMTLQIVNGYTKLEPGLYLRSAFIYRGSDPAKPLVLLGALP